MTMECEGQHRFFVAEAVGVPAEGTVFIIAMCTNCGEEKVHKTQVSTPNQTLLLKSEETKQKN